MGLGNRGSTLHGANFLTFVPEEIRLSEVAELLASLGYAPRLSFGHPEKVPAEPGRKAQWLKIGIAGFGFGTIMLFSLPLYLGLDSFSAPVFRGVFGSLSLLLALPVLVYSASDYWKSALLSVRTKVLTSTCRSRWAGCLTARVPGKSSHDRGRVSRFVGGAGVLPVMRAQFQQKSTTEFCST